MSSKREQSIKRFERRMERRAKRTSWRKGTPSSTKICTVNHSKVTELEGVRTCEP